MKIAAVIVVALLPIASLGQTRDIPQSARDKLAKDLTQLHELIVAAQRKQQAAYAFESPFRGLASGQLTITNQSAGVRAGADLNSTLLFKAQKDQIFPVLDRAGDWYAVAFPEKIKGLSAGWVPARDVVLVPTLHVPPTGQPVASGGSIVESIYKELTEGAVLFRNAYRNSEYFVVTGFTVTLGLPSSISMNFEFK